MSDLIKDSAVMIMQNLSAASREEGGREVPVRLFGSAAVALCCAEDNSVLQRMGREQGDVDLVTTYSNFAKIRKLMGKIGLRENAQNDENLMSYNRLSFATSHNVLVELSGDPLTFHHEIRLGKRLTSVPGTIPIAELVLTKLQYETEYFQKTPKGRASMIDLVALFSDYGMSDDDTGICNSAIGKAVRDDYGLTATVQANLKITLEFIMQCKAGVLPRAAVDQALISCEALQKVIEDTPKTLKWKVYEMAHRIVPGLPIGTDVEEDFASSECDALATSLETE